MPHVTYVKAIAVSLPLFFIFPFAAAAGDGDYFVGADYLFSFYNEPNTDVEASRAFRLSGGRKFSEVSLETQLVTGLEDTDFTVAGQRKTIELDYLASLFLSVPFPKGNEWFRVALGVTHGQLTSTVAGVSRSASDTSVSMALGAKYRVASHVFLNADYTIYLQEGLGAKDRQVEALALGLRVPF